MKIGITELIVVCVVALVLLGPEKLPLYAKKLGEALAAFKKITADTTKELKESVAEPLEEMAKGLGIPEDIIVATVKRYNELCAAGVDEDYGKEKHHMTPVDTAPFYGVRTCAWHLTTLNGCRINTDMQVIREDGTSIEGLYVSGDCTGGMFGDTYPNLFTGLACGRTMTFARRAAKMVTSK